MDLVPPLVTAGGVIIAAGLTLIGVIVVQLWARVHRLEDRLDRVEAERDTLDRALRAAAEFIDRVGAWLADGMAGRPRPRLPDRLREHVDADLWDQRDPHTD